MWVRVARVSRRWAIVGAVVVVVLTAGGGAALLVLASHHAPGGFALASPTANGSAAALAGAWKVAAGSEAGYRAREKFINQAAPTEAVARTSKVTGKLTIQARGSTYVATSADLKVDLVSLVSQDRYAQFQTYQRDFFVRSIYLQTATYPTAEFKADTVQVPVDAVPGPVQVEVPGRLSAHGVTKAVTAEVQAQLSGAQIEVVGTINIDMRDFGIDPPDISFTKAEPGLVVEYHLFLSRAP